MAQGESLGQAIADESRTPGTPCRVKQSRMSAAWRHSKPPIAKPRDSPVNGTHAAIAGSMSGS